MNEHDSWDRAYMDLCRLPAEPEDIPLWSAIEVPVLAILLAITLAIILFGG